MKPFAIWVLAGCLGAAVFASEQIPKQDLSVDQIVEKNIASRGGLDAWRKVQTMIWSGHVDSANAPAADLPFVLAMKRPNKTRFEVTVFNQKSVRVFDGKQGWKLGPNGMGSATPRPYSIDEVSSARDEQVIDGLLIDHEAKGVSVTLEGTDQVGGRDAYRLAAKLPSGVTRHVWIDAQTFLDVKVDRQVRTPLGQTVVVETSYSDFRSVEGLQIPLKIESGAAASEKKDMLTIDKVSLNPPLDDGIFTRPASPQMRRKSVSIDADADASPALSGAGRPAP
ncbi:outer membrane lipoprotein-sorting protein [Trinickia violacea]|uniref:Outer membrane lipoprotein-sorting protein n=1 Tax=Trinickia violacea TaxID=2571746 RepID=A0A4P8ISI5_9BURK|nr:outer membrane lipoprotein-sorting protein [Trinickia violacea]QCP52002.1 outer membrane lipoprotein-sorting protein [Trinickia violacea]